MAPKIFRFLRSIVRSQSDAEDLLQEAYVRFCAIDDIGDIKRPDSFLMSVAYNLAIDHVRRRKNSPVDYRYDLFDVDMGDGRSSAEQNLIDKEELAFMLKSIDGLSRRRREVFTLRRFGGLSFKEVAAHLGVSVSTAEKHMASAVAHFSNLRNDGEHREPVRPDSGDEKKQTTGARATPPRSLRRPVAPPSRRSAPEMPVAAAAMA
ncbi:MAG: sigma-70 family RNA polymerase sigma factor [Rhizomicrobium sp.]